MSNRITRYPSPTLVQGSVFLEKTISPTRLSRFLLSPAGVRMFNASQHNDSLSQFNTDSVATNTTKVSGFLSQEERDAPVKPTFKMHRTANSLKEPTLESEKSLEQLSTLTAELGKFTFDDEPLHNASPQSRIAEMTKKRHQMENFANLKEQRRYIAQRERVTQLHRSACFENAPLAMAAQESLRERNHREGRTRTLGRRFRSDILSVGNSPVTPATKQREKPQSKRILEPSAYQTTFDDIFSPAKTQ